MTVPKCGFASTFTHGAGVTCPCAVVMTYSRPSGVNPPSPLKKIRSRRGNAGVAAGSARWVRVGLKGEYQVPRALHEAAAVDLVRQRPRLSVMMARATDWSRMRSSFRYLVRRPHEDAAGSIDHVGFEARGNQPHDLFLEQLPVTGVIFVPDHQVHRQSLQAPVRVGLHELAHQIDIGRVADLQQHDRQIAGNGVAPEAGLPAAVLDEDARVGAQRGIGVDDGAGQGGHRVARRPRWH